MDPRAYPVIIRPLPPEDGAGFMAEVPDLPGCAAGGSTPAEATENVQRAITAWIETANRRGLPLPPPSRRLQTVSE